MGIAPVTRWVAAHAASLGPFLLACGVLVQGCWLPLLFWLLEGVQFDLCCCMSGQGEET